MSNQNPWQCTGRPGASTPGKILFHEFPRRISAPLGCHSSCSTSSWTSPPPQPRPSPLLSSPKAQRSSESSLRLVKNSPEYFTWDSFKEIMSLEDRSLRRGLETWVLLWQMSANPLWGLGRATRLERERQSAETQPTALLHPTPGVATAPALLPSQNASPT